MRRALTLLAVTGLLMAAVPVASAASPRSDLRVGPMMGVVHAKGNARPGGGGGNPNLVYHNGAVMASGAAVTPIFWGPKWSGSAYQGDVVTGLHGLYAAFGNTGYMGTNTEYTDSSGAHVSKGVSISGSLFDYSATPRRAPSTSTVLGIVQSNIANPVTNGYYPVYTDIKRGSAGYCAWHSWGTVKGVLVQFAFFFDLTGDTGCDPQDPGTSRSQNLEALANVSGHELSEAVTDPHGDGWYDTSGSENSDKCAWVFSQPVSLNGADWKIQGNWSNAAYTTGTGFANRSGQKGCLYN
ncbi:MAG TPA: hypothetical protein VFQ75_06335 [Candidatus Limnocylindrales bacterium]|nr:hypothetical protein [Candidatus Limnocylindrales bacterium]